MLTDTELVDIICEVPPGRPRQVLLAIGRAIEAKVLEKLRAPLTHCAGCQTTYPQGTADGKCDECAAALEPAHVG